MAVMCQLPMKIESGKPNSPDKLVAGAALGFAGSHLYGVKTCEMGNCVDVGMMIEPNG